MEQHYNKKFCLRTIQELKNVLTFMEINYGGMTLDDLEFKLKEYKAPDPLGKILKEMEKNKNV